MKQELKQKWIAALRSGEYLQTRHSLIDIRGYCCLGVLCEVKGIEKDEDEDFVFGGEKIPMGADRALNDCLTAYQRYDLTKMNDTGSSFRKISDWIEENVKGEA